jgi:hypothetical protein
MPDATCMCGHPEDDHDAGECWAEVEWTEGRRQCTCPWYEAAA